MTVSSEVKRSGPYTGNGVTTIFNYGFRIVDENHLRVIREQAGVETVLAIDTDYIVSDVGQASGGQIALVVAPTALQKITILRDVPFTQETDLENQGAYYPEDIERALDLSAMRDQQLQEQLDRAVKVPASADAGALGSLISDIIRLADSADNIDTVADNIGSVNAVAAVADDVAALAPAAAAIPAVATVVDDIPAVAAVASSIPTVAANVSDINNFSKVYQGAHAAAPAMRDDGTPLQLGDLYFDTSLDTMRVLGGSGWKDVGGGGGGAGDMLAATYDPNSVAQDAFNSAYHKYSQASIDAVQTSVRDVLRRNVHAADFGARADGDVSLTACTINSGSVLLTTSVARFTAADVGKTISVGGAGAAGATLLTTIWAFVSSTQVMLATNAATTLTASSVLLVFGTDDTQAIWKAVRSLRKNVKNIWDGLSGQIDTYQSGIVELGYGFHIITSGQFRFISEMGLQLKGKGSRGRNKSQFGATTLLIVDAGGAVGIQFYGNGAREGHIVDLDLCYSNAGYGGNLFEQIGAPGSYPVSCYLGSVGWGGATFMYSANSAACIAFDEFFYPQNCVWDGAKKGVLSDDVRVLAVGIGSIAGTTLTITSMTPSTTLPTGGRFGPDVIVKGGVTCRIVSQLTSTEPGGALGGRGTYQVNVSQTLASTTVVGDIDFGGSNTNLIDCVSYDITEKHIVHLGNRIRYNFVMTSGIVNPINKDCQIGVDLRNVKSAVFLGLDHSGSVGNNALNGWYYLQNCGVEIVGGKMGVGTSAGTLLNCTSKITGHYCETSDGWNVDGGTLFERSNEFTHAAKAWTVSPANTTFVDMGLGKFGPNVTLSYNFAPSSDQVFGIVHYCKEIDNSSQKFVSNSNGVQFKGHGRRTLPLNGNNTISIFDTGKTHLFNGTAAQVAVLPNPTPGVSFRFVHVSDFPLTIAPGGGYRLYAGSGAVKTIADIGSLDKGGVFDVEALANTGWLVTNTAGAWVYT